MRIVGNTIPLEGGDHVLEGTFNKLQVEGMWNLDLGEDIGDLYV